MRKVWKIAVALLSIGIFFITITTIVYSTSGFSDFILVGQMIGVYSIIICIFVCIGGFLTRNSKAKFYASNLVHKEIEYSIDTKKIRFIKKNITINVSNIKTIKMEVNQQIVYNSGITEAIVGGVLFGGSGAVAGSIMGSKPKLSSKAIIYVETDLIQYAGLTITTTPQKGFEICKVIEALMRLDA